MIGARRRRGRKVKLAKYRYTGNEFHSARARYQFPVGPFALALFWIPFHERLLVNFYAALRTLRRHFEDVICHAWL